MKEYRRVNADKIHRQMCDYGKRRRLNRNPNLRSRTKRPVYGTVKERYRDDNLRRKYNLTLEQVNSMVTAQNGVCAICLETFKNTRDTHVDHNHGNGQVRQLLCTACNHGIGNFKEKPINLQRAIDYLQKWNK